MATAWSLEDIKNKALTVSELFGQSGILLQDEGDLADVSLCVLLPESCIAWIIGKAGVNINEIKSITGCNISLAKKETSVRGSRRGVASGSVAAVTKAILVISSLLHEALGTCSLALVVSNGAAGAVIGKAGANLKLLREQTGCRVSMEKPEEAQAVLGGRCLTLSHSDSTLNMTQAIYNIIRIKGFASPTARDILNAPTGLEANPLEYQLPQLPMGYDGQILPDMFGYGAMSSARAAPRFSPYGVRSPVAGSQDICVLHNKRRGKQNLVPSSTQPGSFECSEADRCKGSGGSAFDPAAAAGQNWGGSAIAAQQQQASMYCATHGKRRGQRNLTAHPSVPGVFICLETDQCK